MEKTTISNKRTSASDDKSMKRRRLPEGDGKGDPQLQAAAEVGTNQHSTKGDNDDMIPQQNVVASEDDNDKQATITTEEQQMDNQQPNKTTESPKHLVKEDDDLSQHPTKSKLLHLVEQDWHKKNYKLGILAPEKERGKFAPKVIKKRKPNSNNIFTFGKISADIDKSFIVTEKKRADKSYFGQNFLDKGIIGKGSFGEVHRAIRDTDQHQIAVKIYHCRQKQADVEVENLVKVVLPPSDNVVRFLYSWVDQRRVHIAMELCFCDLRYLKKFTGFDPILPWHLLIGGLKGLAKLHESALIHYDVGAANIFIGNDGNAKMGDLSCSVATRDYANDDDDDQTILGGEHKAPELDKHVITSLADVYSLSKLYDEIMRTPSSGADEFMTSSWNDEYLEVVEWMGTEDYHKRPEAATVLASDLVMKYDKICVDSNVRGQLKQMVEKIQNDEDAKSEAYLRR